MNSSRSTVGHRKQPVVVLSGGGTGGHITPILAVAHELKKQCPEAKIIYIGERGGKFAELTTNHEAIDATYTILAGKFRRYHSRSLWAHITDLKLVFLNVRDLFFMLFGTVQSWFLLRKLRPDVVFLKGGFVGVPVGLAAAALKTPFVTHDSDALPGLANRLVSRWASVHAVAMEPETYAYPKDRTIQVGVLVEPGFQPVDTTLQKQLKTEVGIAVDAIVLLVTGSSSGAQHVNEAMLALTPKLLEDFPKLEIVHQTGKGRAGLYGGFTSPRLHVMEFMRPMYAYTGAADVVVARSSANTLAELGVQGKAVIAVPHPLLTGGHQIKNADLLLAKDAVIKVSETFESTDEIALDNAIRLLLTDEKRRKELATNLHQNTLLGAADKLAGIILKQ